MSDPRCAPLERALELSLELCALAESGDWQATAALDAERRRLLDCVRTESSSFDPQQRLLLRRIGESNDRAIGFLEHRQRIKAREMDTVTTGRRALTAYSATG